ncbi:MAG TPA: hypothetical protein VFT50_06555 [Baekduia sp.]|nr:hypothetical protein [Baekduia sp.]
MKLLSRHQKTEDPAEAPAVDATTPADGPPEAVVEAPEGVRTCPTCQAPLEPEQDWCLQCGSAQSRLGLRMPGMRAAGTVATLTAVLVGGAVAASYAALQEEPPAPPPTTQMAQVPAPAPAPSSATPAPTDPVPTTPATVDDVPAPAPPPAPAPAPAPADDTAPLPDPGPAAGGGGGGGGGGGASTGGSGTSDTSGATGDQGGGDTTGGGSAPAEPTPIALDDGSGALYDPYGRDTAAGDADRALDGNFSTSFPITVADGSDTIGAGLALDLGRKRAVREIDMTLKTPGVGLEVYATDERDLPADVLDSRWAHLRSLTSAGSAVDGHQAITLGKGKRQYRHLLLWFTTPPESGTTVRVTDVQLLG